MNTNQKIEPSRFALIVGDRLKRLQNACRYTVVGGSFPLGRKTLKVVADSPKFGACCECFFERACRAAGRPLLPCLYEFRQDNTDVHYVLWWEEPTKDEQRVPTRFNVFANDPSEVEVIDDDDNLAAISHGNEI